MKVYISAAVSVKNLKQQYGRGIPNDLFQELVQLDPTFQLNPDIEFDENKGGKYGPWIFRQYAKARDLTRGDFNNVADALHLFAKEYKKYPHSNIMDYKSVAEFLRDTGAVGNRELDEKEKKKLLKKQAHHASDQDKKFLVADGDWEVWTPLTYAGSISLAREGGGHKAEWCTAYEGSDNYYRSYTSRGPLYIFINRANPEEKYQTHFDGNRASWFYDQYDREQGKQAFLDFCAQHPAIGDYFEIKNEGGVQTRANSVMGYVSDATEITIPDWISELPNMSFPKTCKKVTLPDSVTVIPSDAFTDSNVEEVVANNITEVKRNAFKNSAIRSIDLTNVTLVEASAFRGCKNLKDIDVPANATLQAFSFCGCDLTGTITQYPETTISAGTYDNNPNLTIVWEDADVKFPINGIHELILKKGKYPEMLAANSGRITVTQV